MTLDDYENLSCGLEKGKACIKGKKRGSIVSAVCFPGIGNDKTGLPRFTVPREEERKSTVNHTKRSHQGENH